MSYTPMGDLGQQGLQRLITVDGDHLGARDHDVAHPHLGDLQHPFQHLLGIVVDQPALTGQADHLLEVGDIFEIFTEQLAQFIEPATAAIAGGV